MRSPTSPPCKTIARAIAGLDPNAPGESRRALYERARTALIAQLRSDAYDDAPAPLHNQGFVPQLVVRGSTAPMRPVGARPLPSDPA